MNAEEGSSEFTDERAVLSCITAVADSVFGEAKCGRVYLALRNGPLVPDPQSRCAFMLVCACW